MCCSCRGVLNARNGSAYLTQCGHPQSHYLPRFHATHHVDLGMANDDGDDADFAAALEESRQATTSGPVAARFDAPSRPLESGNSNSIRQPEPQKLHGKTGPSSILVSYKQKGNPILNGVRALPWEYSETVADYVLGATTCALFLSLKYHRLHPEYIYTRIRALGQKFNLRILLTMVDIENHEDSLKELSKTSLINNVTVILCWTAQEAGRYLELFKSYEGAAPTAIRAHQSTSYSDKLVDFITVPRSINKTDAVGLVSNFGSVRTAVSAKPEEVALVDGWGEKKVQRWCGTVRESFRIRKTKTLGRGLSSDVPLSREPSRAEGEIEDRNTLSADLSNHATVIPGAARTLAVPSRLSTQANTGPDEDEQMAIMKADAQTAANKTVPAPEKANKDVLSEGISAHLERLRRG